MLVFVLMVDVHLEYVLNEMQFSICSQMERMQ